MGSIVTTQRATAVGDVGERGVGYAGYELGGRPGWSFIFERGRYDGFSPDDVDLRLAVTGEVCREVTAYPFPSGWQLGEDVRCGRFAAAFK